MVVVSEKEVRTPAGKRLIGLIQQWDTGEKVFYVNKLFAHIYDMPDKRIGSIKVRGERGWKFQEKLLVALKAKRVTHIKILVTDTNDVYMTPLASYFSTKLFKTMQSSRNGYTGETQRVVALTAWEYQPGRVRLTV